MEFRDIKTWIAKQPPSLEDIPPREESKLVSFHFADIQTSQTSCLWLSIVFIRMVVAPTTRMQFQNVFCVAATCYCLAPHLDFLHKLSSWLSNKLMHALVLLSSRQLLS
jgi:hypothetical protein